MINRLPAWCIINKFPAFYDIESATAIEQTARIYGKMNELVDSYNSFAEKITNTINGFIGETEDEYAAFKVAIRQEFQDFIDTIDLKILAIENDIANFESSTDQKLTGFAADIVAFKTSITTAFATFKGEVNTTLNGFESDIATFKSEVNTTLNGFESNIENFKNETNTALSQFENRVNATLQQMQDDLNEYIEMTKTVTGTNVISITENKNFMHNAVMTSSAPANTPIRIYNENLVDKNILVGEEIQGNSPEQLSATYLVINFVGSAKENEYGITEMNARYSSPIFAKYGDWYVMSFTFDSISWNEPAEVETITSIRGHIETEYGNFDLGDLNVELGKQYTVAYKFASTDNNGTTYLYQFGEVYFVEETTATTATADNTGNVALGDISPSMVAMIEPAQFTNNYDLTLSYVISDFATKSYIDNKIKEVEEKDYNKNIIVKIVDSLATHSPKEIKELVEKGYNIYYEDGNDLLNLVQCSENAAFFIYPYYDTDASMPTFSLYIIDENKQMHLYER